MKYQNVRKEYCRSQWPRGLRRRSVAARLLRLGVRIPLGAWMFVCCVCCVLSSRGLCDELITRPEESYRLWCIVVCDLENLKNEEAMTPCWVAAPQEGGEGISIITSSEFVSSRHYKEVQQLRWIPHLSEW